MEIRSIQSEASIVEASITSQELGNLEVYVLS